jgi:hypothetical protein
MVFVDHMTRFGAYGARWEADAFSFKISTEVGRLLDKYPNRLDIIYDDGLETNSSYGYGELIFWNGTIRFPYL